MKMAASVFTAEIMALAFGAGSTAFASEPAPAWELAAATRGVISVSSGSTTQVDVLATAGYFVSDPLELLFSFRYIDISENAGSLSALSPLAGVAFNFAADRKNAVYLDLLIGPIFQSDGTTTLTNFIYELEVGKRFPIASAVTFKPALAFQGVTSSPSQTTFSIIPLSFSFFLE